MASRRTAEGAHRTASHVAMRTLWRTPRDMLRWATVVIAARVVRADDDTSWVLKVIEEFHAHWREAVMASGRIAASVRGGRRTRWVGSIEVDLLAPDAPVSTQKDALLRDLLGDQEADLEALAPGLRVVVVHAHVVLDCRGHEFPQALAQDLRITWPGARRVHVESIRSTGTVPENLTRIADYITKHVHRYSTAWMGGKTMFLRNYEPEWREYIHEIYDSVDYPKLIFSNIQSQARSEPECTVEPLPVERSSGISAGCSCNDLTTSDDATSSTSTRTATHHLSNIKETVRRRLKDHMRMKDILEHYNENDETNPEKIKTDVARIMSRKPPGLTIDELPIMYSDPAEELELERQRLELRRLAAEVRTTEAEVEATLAAAAKDRAEAIRMLHSPGR